MFILNVQYLQKGRMMVPSFGCFRAEKDGGGNLKQYITNIKSLQWNPAYISFPTQHNFVFKFYTYSLEQHKTPISKAILNMWKNVNRNAISTIITGHRTQGLNSSTTWYTGLIHVTNIQVAANKSWLVRCFPQSPRSSQSNQHDVNHER